MAEPVTMRIASPANCHPDEWAARLELAACYRVLRRSPHLRWVHTHAAGADRPIYAELAARFGAPAYRRIDAPATPAHAVDDMGTILRLVGALA